VWHVTKSANLIHGADGRRAGSRQANKCNNYGYGVRVKKLDYILDRQRHEKSRTLRIIQWISRHSPMNRWCNDSTQYYCGALPTRTMNDDDEWYTSSSTYLPDRKYSMVNNQMRRIGIYRSEIILEVLLCYLQLLLRWWAGAAVVQVGSIVMDMVMIMMLWLFLWGAVRGRWWFCVGLRWEDGQTRTRRL